jgi:predicted nucleotidyltransferase
LLSVLNKISDEYIECFEKLEQAASQTHTDYLLIGATARDLIMESVYGIKAKRQTFDIDIGLCVGSWGTFQKFKDNLKNQGLIESPDVAHIMTFIPTNAEDERDSIRLDLVPYGAINDENGEISWPPNGDVVMSVLGFAEAYESKELIEIKKDLTLPVTSAVGLCLLKFIAWVGRDRNQRSRDAQDIKFVLSNYEQLPGIQDAIFDEEFTERFDHDIEKAVAAKLGSDIALICSSQTLEHINSGLFNHADELKLEAFATEMQTRDPDHAQHNLELIKALKEGFQNPYIAPAEPD